MTLIDVIGGYELPPVIYARPQVRRATMLAASASIILNDLYSMAKESEPGIGDGGLPGGSREWHATSGRYASSAAAGGPAVISRHSMTNVR
jgi:hypothetical protein